MCTPNIFSGRKASTRRVYTLNDKGKEELEYRHNGEEHDKRRVGQAVTNVFTQRSLSSDLVSSHPDSSINIRFGSVAATTQAVEMFTHHSGNLDTHLGSSAISWPMRCRR